MNTPSPLSTDKSAPLLKIYRDNKPFRNITNIVLSLIFAALLAIAAYFAEQKSSLLFAIIFVSIPAIILGIVINLIEDYAKGAELFREDAQKYNDMFVANVNTMNKLSKEFEDLLTNTMEALKIYPPFQKYLLKEQRQRVLIAHFIKKAMQPKLSISDISDHDFYELVQEGIENCGKCSVIHQGKLSLLQKSYGYLNALRSIDSSERILIISKNDNEAQEELKDANKVHEFLSATLPTRSYVIEEDDFFEIAGLKHLQNSDKLPLELNDCALFDGNLLLFRERKKGIVTLSFKGDQEPICEGITKVFNALKNELKYKKDFPNYQMKFIEIKELEL